MSEAPAPAPASKPAPKPAPKPTPKGGGATTPKRGCETTPNPMPRKASCTGCAAGLVWVNLTKACSGGDRKHKGSKASLLTTSESTDSTVA